MNRFKKMTVAWLLCLLVSGVTAQNEHSPLGTNISEAVAWETDWMFVNIAHHSLAWFPAGELPVWGNWLSTSQIAPDGYLNPGQNGILCPIWDAPANISGEFMLTWDGTAAVSFVNQFGSNPVITSNEAGRVEFTLTNQRFLFIEFSGNSVSDPVRNIRLVRAADEENTETFSDNFLNFLRPFRVLRFMDAMATNDSPVVSTADYTPAHALIQRPWGFDRMVELANELEADPWFCVPLQADDAFVQAMADYLAAHLDPSLTVRIELSNEVWNAQFPQHQQAAMRAQALGLSNTGNSWEDAPFYLGYRSAQVHEIFENVFAAAPQSPRLCKVVAWQSVNPFWAENGVLPAYQNESTGNLLPDALAIAPYFGGALGYPLHEATVEIWDADDLFNQLQTGALIPGIGTMEQAIDNVQDYHALCDEMGIPQLISYEGGQHLVAVQGVENNTIITALFQAANRDPRMGDLYHAYLDLWKAEGGGLFTMFTSHGRYTKWGSWGLKEYLSQSEADAPKYQACMDFIDDNQCSWNGCSFEWGIVIPTKETMTEGYTLQIFPNPVQDGLVNIEIKQASTFQKGMLRVLTAEGKVVLERELSAPDFQMDLGDLQKGIYLVQIASEAGVQIGKIVLQ